jgi:peptidoglycan/LPS O-acetylase OafA/YrhL
MLRNTPSTRRVVALLYMGVIFATVLTGWFIGENLFYGIALVLSFVLICSVASIYHRSDGIRPERFLTSLLFLTLLVVAYALYLWATGSFGESSP